MKIQQEMWESVVFETRRLLPSLLPAQQHGDWTADCCGREHWALSLLSPQSEVISEGFLPRRSRTLVFLLPPQLPVAEVQPQVGTVNSWELPFSFQIILMEWRLHLGCGVLKILGTRQPFPKSWSTGSAWGKQAKKTSGCCLPVHWALTS